MKPRNPTLSFYLLVFIPVLPSVGVFCLALRVSCQTRERRATSNTSTEDPATDPRAKTDDVVKVDVDLVTIDALVLQKNTARGVGGLKKEDFILFEDGSKQEITHFSQDTLPLSVLLLIDRGGCLDPFGDKVHRAASDAIARLKPADEVAVMTYHDTT